MKRTNYDAHKFNGGHCTCFWDHIYGVYIGGCCKIHDETLSFTRFFSCLSKRIDIFSSFVLAGSATVGVWFLYTKKMLSRKFS